VSTVGFPDSMVRESHDRVPAAIRNAGLAIASRGPGMSGSTS
jgi:predicted ATPase with chaperone activity